MLAHAPDQSVQLQDLVGLALRHRSAIMIMEKATRGGVNHFPAGV